MKAARNRTAAAPTTEELRRALEESLGQPVMALRREPSVYSSSFAIEELDIELSDGRRVDAIFKNVGPGGLFGDAITAKPAFVFDPRREIQIYQSILPSLQLGAAALWGAVMDQEAERYWLFLERAPGVELYQIGEFDMWLEAARWLARLHSSPACSAEKTWVAAPLALRHDATLHQTWFDRANDNTGGQLDVYKDSYEAVLQSLQQAPRSLIHGEFYASNVLLDRQGAAVRVCPIDWEMAGVGPTLLDVAALASGSWGEAERLRILEAYLSELPGRLQPSNAQAIFERCLLQNALQWLGWANQWTPPSAHQRNWLLEVQTLFASIS